MKNLDYETIAYMFARAAEALMEKAQREQEAETPPQEEETPQPKGSRKFSEKYKGRVKGSKNWSQSEKDHAITVWSQTTSYEDIAAGLNRPVAGVKVMIGKMLKGVA